MNKMSVPNTQTRVKNKAKKPNVVTYITSGPSTNTISYINLMKNSTKPINNVKLIHPTIL